ncbi:pirin family protein [Cylindrospermopsis raciborskii]|uniref:pirin family protein n=1 Tax=Cylindrospermopsis raciborskii TaxID=77022 RepID=UPI000778A048|nr:pirin family protein [Cylindrospermopsis raciborskii]MCZ2201727.1 pirin family protein [Cylindrospermopsis raciborskii PAMP2012]MCZ2204974.1 pirin family protein [Cylindrospermopsis raciborskii PAMP2011]
MIYHAANTRGMADHGWLKAKHTFSFANYHDPSRMGFGSLRVINDDHIAPGGGFATHPHRDMEIVTIPLQGSLRHEDSMGNSQVLQKGEIQSMSAGTGILHSEFNHGDEDLKLLQIWVLPKKIGVQPRYEQKAFNPSDRKQKLQTVVSPDGEGLGINQDAWFFLADLEGTSVEYKLHEKGQGVYVFVISGFANVNGKELFPRDGLGLEEDLHIQVFQQCELLVMEVPMLSS